MSYPRNYRMPMPPQQYQSYNQPQRQNYPQQNNTSNYPSSYPQQSQQPTPYPTTHAAPYPTSSAQPPYPTPNSTQSRQPAPYPTSQVQSMSINNTTTTNTTTTTSHSEVQQWLESATTSLKALIKDASNEELNQLVDNEDKLIDLVQSSEQVKKMQRKIEEMSSQIKDTAVTNLSMEPEVRHLQEEIVQLANRQNDLKQKYAQMQSQLSGKVSLDGMLAVLQAATSESEEESESIAQAYMEADEGNEQIDQFVEAYMNKRIEYHLRKVKSEKMVGLVTNPNRSTMNSPPGAAQQPQLPPRQAMPSAYGYGGY